MSLKKAKRRFAAVCETGLSREENQDCVFSSETGLLFAVADGMGGGSEGGKASAILCRRIAETERSPALEEVIKAVDAAIDTANSEIFEYATNQGFRQMGSTLALMAFDGVDGACAAVGHVGDSRVYRIRGGVSELLTIDHSVGEELRALFAGRKDASSFSDRSNRLAHVLTRAVGVSAQVKCEWMKIDVSPGDRFLLCSDGLHDVIRSDEIAGLLSAATPDAAVSALSAEIVRRGAPDNYSIIVIFEGA